MVYEDNSSTAEELNDSSLYYHNISKDKNLAFNKRLNAINKSLFFLKNNKNTLYSQLLYEKNHLLFSLKEYDSLNFFNELLIVRKYS